MAAAEARSGLPETLRCAARGRPLAEGLSGAPFAARLVPEPPGASPWFVECRRCGAEALTGEWLLDTSRCALAAVPFRKLGAGGSGSGRARCWADCGAVARFAGEETLVGAL
jgi:hypothetical protein